MKRGMKLRGLGVAALLAPLTVSAPAEPLLSPGSVTPSCSRLVSNRQPAEGLNHPVNLMLYAWVQGYISAAYVALLEYDGKYVDMSELTDARVVTMILDFCKANPDKKPANALDSYVKVTRKLKAQWTTGTVEWDE